jgi:hypothetical protein
LYPDRSQDAIDLEGNFASGVDKNPRRARFDVVSGGIAYAALVWTSRGRPGCPTDDWARGMCCGFLGAGTVIAHPGDSYPHDAQTSETRRRS